MVGAQGEIWKFQTLQIAERCLLQLQLQKLQKIGVLINFAKSTKIHVYRGLFFDKVSGFQAATLLKKRRLYRCFTMNFAKFLRAPFLQNTSRRLLLSAARILLKPNKEAIKRCSTKCVIFQSLIYDMKLLENLPKSLTQTNEEISFRQSCRPTA